MRLLLLLSLWIGLGCAFPVSHAPALEHENAFHQPASPSPAMESERFSEVFSVTADHGALVPLSAAPPVPTIRLALVPHPVMLARFAMGPTLDQRPPPRLSLT